MKSVEAFSLSEKYYVILITNKLIDKDTKEMSDGILSIAHL